MAIVHVSAVIIYFRQKRIDLGSDLFPSPSQNRISNRPIT